MLLWWLLDLAPALRGLPKAYIRHSSPRHDYLGAGRHRIQASTTGRHYQGRHGQNCIKTTQHKKLQYMVALCRTVMIYKACPIQRRHH